MQQCLSQDGGSLKTTLPNDSLKRCLSCDNLKTNSSYGSLVTVLQNGRCLSQDSLTTDLLHDNFCPNDRKCLSLACLKTNSSREVNSPECVTAGNESKFSCSDGQPGPFFYRSSGFDDSSALKESPESKNFSRDTPKVVPLGWY